MLEWVRLAAETISTVFLTLVKGLLAPLLFGMIVSSLGRAKEGESLGRIGAKAILYFEVVTTVALLVGWASMSIFAPGLAIAVKAGTSASLTAAPLSEILVASVPASGLEVMAKNQVLPMIVFFGLIGWAARQRQEKAAPLIAFATSVQAVTMGYAKIVMKLAPLGMIAAVTVTTIDSAGKGFESLARFVLAAISAQLFMAVVVYGLVMAVARLPLRRFFSATRSALGIALTTTSSAAALPKAIEGMERFGIRPELLGMVMPLGLSFNLSGSTIQLMMGVLFAAQAARISLDAGQMVMVLLTLKIVSKGVAGIPRANFVILSGTLPVFGLPLDTLPLLLAVDGLIDMVRTPVNVLGNCLAPAVIARSEGEI